MALFFFPTFTHAGALTEPPNNLGLVGYWSMNDGNGSTATDFSGNGNDGTLTNMDASTDWVNGRLNSALDFDGSDDSVCLDNAGNCDSNDSNTTFDNAFSTRSVALWFKADNTSDTQILYEEGGSFNGINMYLKSGNLYIGAWSEINNWAGSWLSTGVQTGEWYHAVLTFDGSGQFKLYLNGNEKQSVSSGADIALHPGAPALGAMRFDTKLDTGDELGDGFYYNGLLDEGRVYNRVLTSSEVTDLYNTGFAKVNDSRELSSISGLKGWWPFDGENISGSTAEDASGNGNDGTINGASTAIGRMGQALDFDSSNQDFIYVGSGNFGTTTYTVSAWIKASSIGSGDGGAIIGNRPSGSIGKSNYELVWVKNGNGKLTISHHNGSSFDSLETSGTYTDGEWHHVVGLYDGNEQKIYVDGDLKVSASASDPVKKDNVIVGKRNESSTDYFEGKIDDPRVYDRALTADEIQRLYNATRPDDVNTSQNDRLTSGLVGQWSFDGNNMDWTATNEARDTSGNGNHGNVTNFGKEGAAIGQIGQALDFDGSDDYVKVGDPNSITDGDFTLSLWAKRPPGSSDTASPSAFSQNIPSNWPNDLFILYVGDDKQTTNPGVRVYWDAGTALTYDKDLVDGQWHHYVLTRDSSTGDFELFVDGTSVKTANKSGTWTSSEMGIGADSDNGTWRQEMEGQIDSVRTYDRILSADEIQRLYNMGRK